MKKVKRKYNSTSRKMKSAGIAGGVELPRHPRKGEWQIAKESGKVPGAPKTRPKGKKPLEYGEDVIIEMARDRAGGMSSSQLASKYDISKSYVEDALRNLYINSTIGREILKGVLLEGAIAMGMQARKKMPELNGMQSVVATGILTSRFVELEKHSKDATQEVDFASIAAAADKIDSLVQSVGGIMNTGPSVLDVESEVTREE